MAYKRKPLYHFQDETQTGINKIPLEKIIFLESARKLYAKISNGGLSDSSTIHDAITNGNLILVGGDGENTYTGSITKTEISLASDQDTFYIDFKPGLIDVYVNGFALFPSDWVEGNNTITFNPTLKAGDDVLFTVYNFTDSSTSQPTTTPILNAPTDGDENTTIDVIITNYSATANYSINITGGVYVRNGDTIHWTLPEVNSDISLQMSVMAQEPEYDWSNKAIETITVNNIPKTDTPILAGDTSPVENTVDNITIINYSSTATYNISVDIGTFTRSNDVISWTIPDGTAGQTGLLTITSEEPNSQISDPANFGITITSQSTSKTPTPTLAGNTTPEENTINDITITNYDANNIYTISVDLGTYTQNGNTISWDLTGTSDGDVGNLTVISQASGLDASDPANFGIVVQVASQPKTETPILTGPTTGVESHSVDIVIDNYSLTSTYTTLVSGGSYVRNGDTITWTLPEVSADETHRIEVQSQESNESISDSGILEVTVQNATQTTMPILDGPALAFGNEEERIIISNYSTYDTNATFDIEVTNAGWSREEDIITISIPNTGQNYDVDVAVKVIEDNKSWSIQNHLIINTEPALSEDTNSIYLINDWANDIDASVNQNRSFILSLESVMYENDSNTRIQKSLTMPALQQQVGEDNWRMIKPYSVIEKVYPGTITSSDSSNISATGLYFDKGVYIVDDSGKRTTIPPEKITVTPNSIYTTVESDLKLNIGNRSAWDTVLKTKEPNIFIRFEAVDKDRYVYGNPARNIEIFNSDQNLIIQTISNIDVNAGMRQVEELLPFTGGGTQYFYNIKTLQNIDFTYDSSPLYQVFLIPGSYIDDQNFKFIGFSEESGNTTPPDSVSIHYVTVTDGVANDLILLTDDTEDLYDLRVYLNFSCWFNFIYVHWDEDEKTLCLAKGHKIGHDSSDEEDYYFHNWIGKFNEDYSYASHSIESVHAWQDPNGSDDCMPTLGYCHRSSNVYTCGFLHEDNTSDYGYVILFNKYNVDIDYEPLDAPVNPGEAYPKDTDVTHYLPISDSLDIIHINAAHNLISRFGSNRTDFDIDPNVNLSLQNGLLLEDISEFSPPEDWRFMATSGDYFWYSRYKLIDNYSIDISDYSIGTPIELAPINNIQYHIYTDSNHNTSLELKNYDFDLSGEILTLKMMNVNLANDINYIEPYIYFNNMGETVKRDYGLKLYN